MGTDNLFHKRKAINTNKLSRRKAVLDAHDRVLIVCEGEKTEPLYFTDLINHYKINSANVEITGDSGSAPRSILKYAKQKYMQEKNSGIAYDRVYCVFDKDTHNSYDETMQAIKAATPKNTFFAINSVPSFEYWLLLHFDPSSKPYNTLPRKSVGDQVMSDLKKYMPDYDKASTDVFIQLITQLDFAINNAERILNNHPNGSDNPSTKVHQLVQYLQRIKKE